MTHDTNLRNEMNRDLKEGTYKEILGRIKALTNNEDDWIATMATVACELHHGFDYYHWTGFYRTIGENLLKIGPYQGTHGCLSISFERGVCGAAAKTKKTQIVKNVHDFPGHIACSATTVSEIVVPIIDKEEKTVAVLDVDSNLPEAFDEIDQKYLEELCLHLKNTYFS